MTRHDPGTPAAGHPPGPGNFYDLPRLASRLGMTRKSLTNALGRRVDWIPAPDLWLNDGPVWHEETLDGIEGRRRGKGRPRHEEYPVPPTPLRGD